MFAGVIVNGSFSKPKKYIKGEIIVKPTNNTTKGTFGEISSISENSELAKIVKGIRDSPDGDFIEKNPELFKAPDPASQPTITFKLPHVTPIKGSFMSEGRTCIIQVPFTTVCGYLLIIPQGGDISMTKVINIPTEQLGSRGYIYKPYSGVGKKNHGVAYRIAIVKSKPSMGALEFAWLRDTSGLYYPATITGSDTCDTEKKLTFKVPKGAYGTFEFAGRHESHTLSGPSFYHPRKKGKIDDLVILTEHIKPIHYKINIEEDESAVNRIGNIDNIKLETYSGKTISGFWHTKPDNDKKTFDIIISADVPRLPVNIITKGGPDGKSTGRTQRGGLLTGNSKIKHILTSPTQPGFASEYTISMYKLVGDKVALKVPMGNHDANFFKSFLYDKGYATLMHEKFNVADIDISCDSGGTTNSVFAVSANDESVVYNIGSLTASSITGTTVSPAPRLSMLAHSTEDKGKPVVGVSCSIERGSGIKEWYLTSETLKGENSTLRLGSWSLPSGSPITKHIIWDRLDISLPRAITKIKMRNLIDPVKTTSEMYVVSICGDETQSDVYLGKISMPKTGAKSIEFQAAPFLSTAPKKIQGDSFGVNRYTSVSLNDAGTGLITELDAGCITLHPFKVTPDAALASASVKLGPPYKLEQTAILTAASILNNGDFVIMAYPSDKNNKKIVACGSIEDGPDGPSITFDTKIPTTYPTAPFVSVPEAIQKFDNADASGMSLAVTDNGTGIEFDTFYCTMTGGFSFPDLDATPEFDPKQFPKNLKFCPSTFVNTTSTVLNDNNPMSGWGTFKYGLKNASPLAIQIGPAGASLLSLGHYRSRVIFTDRLATSARTEADEVIATETAEQFAERDGEWTKGILMQNPRYAYFVDAPYQESMLAWDDAKIAAAKFDKFMADYPERCLRTDMGYVTARENALNMGAICIEKKEAYNAALLEHSNLIDRFTAESLELRNNEMAEFTDGIVSHFAEVESTRLAELRVEAAAAGASEEALELVSLEDAWTETIGTAFKSNVVALVAQVILEFILHDNTNYRAYRLFNVQPTP